MNALVPYTGGRGRSLLERRDALGKYLFPLSVR